MKHLADCHYFGDRHSGVSLSTSACALCIHLLHVFKHSHTTVKYTQRLGVVVSSSGKIVSQHSHFLKFVVSTNSPNLHGQMRLEMQTGVRNRDRSSS